MFSKFGSGSVQPRQIFQIWLVVVRFEPNFENISPGPTHHSIPFPRPLNIGGPPPTSNQCHKGVLRRWFVS